MVAVPFVIGIIVDTAVFQSDNVPSAKANLNVVLASFIVTDTFVISSSVEAASLFIAKLNCVSKWLKAIEVIGAPLLPEVGFA